MRVNYVKVHQSEAKKELDRLKSGGELLDGFRIKRDGQWVLIPVKNSDDLGDFEAISRKRMEHVGSFERVSDFFVIKERDGWEDVLNEIKDKQSPRAVFLDEGVEGSFRIRRLSRIYGTGRPAGVHRENGLRYNIDLERAYFSPRLAGLRSHIVEGCLRSPGRGLIVDMYAGVGPVSIPLLRGGFRVLSIDINPDAVALLNSNMRLNKVRGETLIADSNTIYACIEDVREVVMNNPTQPLSVSKDIIKNLNAGTTVHLTHISNRMERAEFEETEVLEERIVHGYSPSSSLFYFRLRKK